MNGQDTQGSGSTRLDGRVAIVTGAGQGVGRGIALALADAGARVVVSGRTVSKCHAVVDEIVARGGTALANACDVKDLADVQRCVDETVATFGTVDILVNNAQQVPNGPLLEVTDADANDGWASGPLACLRFMRICHPHLSGGGVIINLASRSGVKPDPINCGVYAGVKEAIRAMTRSAAWEWADDGIRTYALLPLAATPALEDYRQNQPDAYERVVSAIPMKRFGDSEVDIGRVAVFLASDDAGYLTGISIPVDGGAAHIG